MVKEGHMKIRKTIDSFNYAINGLLHSVKTQRNMKIHIAIALITLLVAGVSKVSRVETILLFVAITLVLMTEMLNTAIEAVVDMISQKYHPLAAIAKNVAAAAVLVTAINAVIVGYLIFYDKLSSLSFQVLHTIINMPVHLTVISLLIVVFIVIAIKASGRHGTFLRGGMPSGHSALAASIFTSITLLTSSLLISALAGLLSLLVLHSRLEAKVHTLREIIIGALVGFLTTILIFQLVRL
jgi:diacylglycerol kinase (ATP)